MTCKIDDTHLNGATLTDPTIKGDVKFDPAAVDSILEGLQPPLNELIEALAAMVTEGILSDNPVLQDPTILGTVLLDEESAQSFVDGMKAPLLAAIDKALDGKTLVGIHLDSTSSVNVASAVSQSDQATQLLFDAIAPHITKQAALLLLGTKLTGLDLEGVKINGAEITKSTFDDIKSEHGDFGVLHIDKELTATQSAAESIAAIVASIHKHDILTNKDGEEINGKGLLTKCDYDKLEALINSLTTFYGCEGQLLTPADRRATCEDLKKLGDKVAEMIAEIDVTDQIVKVIEDMGLVTKEYFDAKHTTLFVMVEDMQHDLDEVKHDVDIIKIQVDNDVVTTVALAKSKEDDTVLVLTQDTLNMATGARKKGVEVGRVTVGVKWPDGGKPGEVLTQTETGEPKWEESAITTRDTASVLLTGDGSSERPLEASIPVSSEPNNTFATTTSGAYGHPMAMTPSKTLTHKLVPTGGTGGSAQTNPNLHEMEVKVSTQAGNKLTVGKDGLYVDAPDEVMGVCEAFDKLPQTTSFGDKPKLIISDNGECKVVTVSTTGIFSDIRAGAKASPATIIKGQASKLTFSARNVSAVTVDKVRIIATMPEVTAGRDYTVTGPTISKPEHVTVKKITDGTYDAYPLRKGDTVELVYDVEFYTNGTFNFSSTIDIMDESVLDFDTADDYAVTSVSVSSREIEGEDPTSCPLMRVEASFDGKKYFPMTLVELTGNRPYWSSVAASKPGSVVFMPAQPSGDTVLHIRSAVPITAQAVIGNGAGSAGAVRVVTDGVPYSVGATRAQFPENPTGSAITPGWDPIPSSNGVLEGKGGAKEFTVTLPAASSAEGGGMFVVVRPSPECIAQAFVVLIGGKRRVAPLAVSGSKIPPHKKYPAYGDSRTPTEATLAGGVEALVESTYDITPSEIVTINAKRGQPYDFALDVEIPRRLPIVNTVGAVAITTSPTFRHWDVVIDSAATAEHNRVDGPVTINIVD